jgi:hypothetical protein
MLMPEQQPIFPVYRLHSGFTNLLPIILCHSVRLKPNKHE